MKSSFRLLLVFSIAFSLATLTGPMSNGFQLPTVHLAHANKQPCEVVSSSGACSERWYPAGPAMDTESVVIFTDSTAEYTNLLSGTPGIDFTDTPCSPAVCASLTNDPRFLVTAPTPEDGYFEIEFHLANTFWNCPFNFGGSACGIQIRQAVAHMFDKSSFCRNSVIATVCIPLDVPVSTASEGGLPSPNPCGYDAQFPQTGTDCVVGSPGGTAYRIGASSGANGNPWLYAPGSADLNAAAQHLVNAGIATGFNSTSSRLTNPVSNVTPSFFIRSDSPARKQLGDSLASQICYLFTGLYTQPCAPFLSTVEGPITAFPGLLTNGCGPGLSTACFTSIALNWWMYTAGFEGQSFFDGSLYFTYNSRFVSGFPGIQPPNGPCSAQSVPTASASDYMYLCSSTYDNLSSQMENSPCLSSAGDPAVGQANNGPGGACLGTTQLSAISAGIQAEAYFGANAFTIPSYEGQSLQFGYLNGWTRAINSVGGGLPNYFTWLNARNPTPATAGTLRQGFSVPPRSLNPYIASTRSDFFIVNNIYDSLSTLNPLAPNLPINWMTSSRTQVPNTSLSYTPPAGTVTTYRFTLWNTLFFQDSRPVTAYDVAFSYLSMIGSGASAGVGASAMTGITILGPRVFDIGLSSAGPFVLPNLTAIPILPARYWTNSGGSTWDNAVHMCTGPSGCQTSQFTLSGSTVNCSLSCTTFNSGLMTVNAADTASTFDPGFNGILIGSGPWECRNSSGVVGGGCYNTAACPPGPCPLLYTLTRFGESFAPASSVSGIYFRSSGNLALYDWTQENDITPISSVSAISFCFNQPVNLNGPCAHWQQGIGASATGIVGINQVSVVEIRFNLNWISPYEWPTNPPLGIGIFPPVLYEGSIILNPCSIDPAKGYDC